VDEPRWLDEAEARAWLGYRRMRALLDLNITHDLGADTALSDADYDVLSTLSETPDHQLRLTSLAEHMHWSKSRLSHHIARMQQRGLLTRGGCPSDARASVVSLTEDGWRAIRAAAPHHVASVRRHFVDLLSREQIDVFGEIADTVVRALRERST